MQDELTETSISSNDSVELSGVSFLDFRSKVRSRERPQELSKVPIPAHDEDFFRDPKNCTSLLKWSTLDQIYPILGAYGGPTCIYPTKYCSVIGTAKGVIMIFSVRQQLLNTLAPHCKTALNDNEYLRSPVRNVVVCADGTHLAASYHSGDVFIWNLNATEGEVRITGARTITNPLKAILHITEHCGTVINGIGFVALRHTALIVSDNSGQIRYHNGYRSRLWSLTYKSERIIEISHKSQLLNLQVAPYNKSANSANFAAVLTTVELAVISANPSLSTLFVEKVPFTFNQFPITNNCLEWRGDTSVLAYSLNNKVRILIFDKISSFTVERRLSWEAGEAILSLEWINEQLLGILTISHQFLMVDILNDFKSVIELDLLPHDLLIPLDKHFAVHNNELYLLTHYTFKIGKFVTWLDITLNRVQKGDYVGALSFFGSLLKPDLSIAYLIKLENDQQKKENQLKRPFYNLSLAALRFVLGESTVDYNEVYVLFFMVLQTVGMFKDEDVRKDYTAAFLEQALEFFRDRDNNVLIEVLANHVMGGMLTALPPVVFKEMLKHYAEEGKSYMVEELIMMLNPQMLDIDLAVRLCKTYGLLDALVSVWNEMFGDYVTPLAEALRKISRLPKSSGLFDNVDLANMNKIFDYLSFAFTGRRYPSGAPISPDEMQTKVKASLYRIIFSGACIEWPANGHKKLHTKLRTADEPAFPYFRLLLDYNPERFLSTLNEAFEDPYFNENDLTVMSEEETVPVNRQNIIHIMLDIIRDQSDKEGPNKTMLAIFIAENSAKFSQFIRLSNQDLDRIIDVLCQSPRPELKTDLQRAIESLLTAYTPSNIDKLVTQLKNIRFNRVLFTIYLKAKRYVDLFLLTVESSDTKEDFGETFLSIIKTVLENTKNDAIAHSSILNIIEENLCVLARNIRPESAALYFDGYDPEIHNLVLALCGENYQRDYLERLSTLPSWRKASTDLKNKSLELTVKALKGTKLLTWLHTFDLRDVDAQLVLRLLEQDGNLHGASIVHMRLQEYTSAIDDLLLCIRAWFQEGEQSFEHLNLLVSLAADAADSSSDSKRSNWTRILACLIEQYGDYKMCLEQKDGCNRALQKVFVRLAVSDTVAGGKRELSDILTGVLEHQDIILKKAHDLNELLLDIFRAYVIEEHVSRIILKIMEDSSGDIARKYDFNLQKGRSISNDECEVCGKKIWGKGLNLEVFQIWEAGARKELKRENVDGSSIILFFCRHGFHKGCLENLGQHTDDYSCLTCHRR